MAELSFWRDERAIEGLPIRLVIALVVGVASLGVMMNVISGIDTLGMTELDTQPEPEVIDPGPTEVEVRVVDSERRGVAGVTVIVRSGTAQLDSIVTGETGENGTAHLQVEPRLGPNQQDGTLELDLKPPSGDYTDRRENTAILVVEG